VKASRYSLNDPSAPQKIGVRLQKVKPRKSALHEANHELLRRHADLTMCSRAKVRQAPLPQPCRLCHLGITKAFEIDRSVIVVARKRAYRLATDLHCVTHNQCRCIMLPSQTHECDKDRFHLDSPLPSRGITRVLSTEYTSSTEQIGFAHNAAPLPLPQAP
jgi:hypothetical protein